MLKRRFLVAVGGGIALPVILTAVVIIAMLTAARIVILSPAQAAAGLNANLTLTVSSKPSVVLTELIANLSHALNPITPTNAGVTAGQIAVQATLSNAQTDRESASLFAHLAGSVKTAIQKATSTAAVHGQMSSRAVTAVQMGTAIHPLNQSLPLLKSLNRLKQKLIRKQQSQSSTRTKAAMPQLPLYRHLSPVMQKSQAHQATFL